MLLTSIIGENRQERLNRQKGKERQRRLNRPSRPGRLGRLIAVGFVAAVTAVVSVVPAAASSDDDARLVLRYDTTFNTIHRLVFGNTDNTDNTDNLIRHGLFTGGAFAGFTPNTTQPISAQLDSALRDNTRAVIAEADGKTALELMGQTYYRVSGLDNYEDETGEGHYRAKFQAELRWFFLQSGLFQKDGRQKVANLKERIARAGYEKERTDINDFRLKDMLANHYDSLLSGLLQRRLNLLRLLEETQDHLLDREGISSDRTVRALEARMDAERKFAAIEGVYPPAASLAGVRMLEIRVDSAQLISHMANTQGDMKILQLRMQLLEQQAQNEKWWQPLRVGPFIRYAHYFRSGAPNSNNLDVGLVFTIPLDPEYLRKRKTLRTEAAVLDAEKERLSRRVADKTSLVIAEIGRLNRASVSELTRVSELREYLRKRTHAYNKGVGTYNRLARAEEYVMYIAALERVVEMQYKRDCLLADLQAMLPDGSLLQFLSYRIRK